MIHTRIALTQASVSSKMGEGAAWQLSRSGTRATPAAFPMTAGRGFKTVVVQGFPKGMGKRRQE